MYVYIEDGVHSSCHQNNLRLFSANVPVINKLLYSYKARKVNIIKTWSPEIMKSGQLSDYVTVLDDAVWQSYGDRLMPYLNAVLQPVSNVHLVLSTAMAYENDIVGDLHDYLVAKGVSIGLLDAFVTVASELIYNAVLHGNLGLNLNFDVSEDEVVHYTVQAFEKIAEHLAVPSLALRPVVITVNLLNNSIALDVQDQGDGFDFDTFKEKYKNSQLQKGMDLVFLLSKDISYDKESRTMSVLIDDPDSLKPATRSINYAAKPIGILTRNPRQYALVSSALHEAGFRTLHNLAVLPQDIVVKSEKLALVIALQDKDGSLPLDELCRIRGWCDKYSLPILCQKNAANQADAVILETANDFLSTPLNLLEIVQRTRAQISLLEARKDIMAFSRDYQIEIRQAEKTIAFLEACAQEQWSILPDCSYDVRLFGTHTATNLADRLVKWRKDITHLYGQGFFFNIDGQAFFLMMSIPDGLSPILILSYLKGYTQRLRDSDVEMTPASIIALISSYIAALIPSMQDLQLLCLSYDAEQGALVYQRYGQFALYRFYESKAQPILEAVDTPCFDGVHYFITMTPDTHVLIADARLPYDNVALAEALYRKLNPDIPLPDTLFPPALLVITPVSEES